MKATVTEGYDVRMTAINGRLRFPRSVAVSYFTGLNMGRYSGRVQWALEGLILRSSQFPLDIYRWSDQGPTNTGIGHDMLGVP